MTKPTDLKEKDILESLAEYITKPKSLFQIAEWLGISKSEAVAMLDELNASDTPAGWVLAKPSTLDNDRRLRQLTIEHSELNDKYKKALGVIDDLQASLDVSSSISDFTVDRMEIEHNSEKHECVPLIALSDWHVGELVKGETVNGLNEYNPGIAQERSIKLFNNIYKLINKERAAVNINKAVIWLGGDFISGYIHEELVESNTMSPTEEILFAEEILCAGLDMLLAKSDLAEILVPTSWGNHGRSTVKSRMSTGAYNNFEWLMYHSLAKHYRNEPRIKFQVSDSYANYVKILDKTVRFCHGDMGFKFNGGVGGVSVPLNKYVMRMNQSIKADLTVLGHYHTLKHDTLWSLNGSLIGAGGYSICMGFAPEPPQQMFRLVDSKYGFTGMFPLFCD